MTERKSAIGYWTGMVTLGGLLYGLSFGPAMWLVDRKFLPAWTKQTVAFTYYPMFWVSQVGPRPIRDAIRWYAEVGGKRRADPVFDDPDIMQR